MDTIPQDNQPRKQCNKCFNLIIATPEYFYRRKDSKDGLRAACIACENPARLPQKDPDPEGFRRCTKCEQIFPKTLEFFTKKKNNFHSICKTCKNADAKIYYSEHADEKKQYFQENKEHIKVRMKQYCIDNKDDLSRKKHQRYLSHKEERKVYDRRYRETHKARYAERTRRYREEHREELRQNKKIYYSQERGRLSRRVAWHKRQARKKMVTGTLTPDQIQEKLKAQKYRCYYAACGHAKFEKKNGKYIYHLEHTVPLSRPEAGPRHDVNYVVLACPTCNLKKGTKMPHEFFQGGRLF